jgi:hypothetical protein
MQLRRIEHPEISLLNNNDIARSDQNGSSLGSSLQGCIGEVEQNEVGASFKCHQAFWKRSQGLQASLRSQMRQERFSLSVVRIPTQIECPTGLSLLLNQSCVGIERTRSVMG